LSADPEESAVASDNRPVNPVPAIADPASVAVLINARRLILLIRLGGLNDGDLLVVMVRLLFKIILRTPRKP
jgi:hypothetical protein